MKDWVEALKSQRSHQEFVRVVLRLLFLLGRATTPVSVWKLEEDVHPLKETDHNSTADADEGGGCPGLTPFTPNDARPIHTANTLISLPLTSSVPRSVGDAAADIAKDTMILDTDSVVIPENTVTDDAAISEDHVCLDRVAESNISKSNTSSSCSSSYSPAVTSGSTTGDQHKHVDASCLLFTVDINCERNSILLSASQSSTSIQSTDNVSLLSPLPSSSCSSSKSPSVTSGSKTFDQPIDDASCGAILSSASPSVTYFQSTDNVSLLSPLPSSSCSSSYSPAVTSGSTTGDQHKDVDASCPFFNVDRNRERNPILLSALQSSTYIQSTNNVSLLSQLPSSSCSSSKSPSVTSGCTTFDQPNDDASCTFSKVNESRESYTIAGSSPPQTPLTRKIGQIFGSGDRLRQRTHAQIPDSHEFVDALHGKVMIV